MRRDFQTIGLIARTRLGQSNKTLLELINYLTAESYQLVIESETAKLLDNHTSYDLAKKGVFGKGCDLIIVIGGDGSMLNESTANA